MKYTEQRELSKRLHKIVAEELGYSLKHPELLTKDQMMTFASRYNELWDKEVYKDQDRTH